MLRYVAPLKRVLSGAAIAILLLMGAAPAFAGGWAVTSFDDAPGEFTAGESYQLHYTILQHGQTPVNVDSTTVILRSTESSEMLTFEGQSAGEVGRYLVEVSIPTNGSWGWEVTQGFFGAQALGELPIVAPPSAGWSATGLLRVLLPLLTIAALSLLLSQLGEFRRTRTTGPRLGSSEIQER